MVSSDRALGRAGRLAVIATIAGVASGAVAAEQRTIVVHEGATTTLAGGAAELKVVKLNGYSIDVRINGEKRRMKLGEGFTPEGADCAVTFKKISPETEIARFQTDCP